MSWFYRNESLKVYRRRYPVTSLFILANIVVFLLMTWMGGTHRHDMLLEYGAFFTPAIMEGEYYRLITPIFIHIGWEHLLFNCFSIYIFAPGLEIMLGKIRYLILYIGTGIAGFVATFLFADPNVISAGASGAIFGLYGMFAYLSQYRKDMMDVYSRQIIMPILLFGVISTFVIPGISMTGHFGGLAAGYLLGYVLAR